MRKWIIENFALDAFLKINGLPLIRFPRASRIIAPLFILSGIAEIYQTGEIIVETLTAIACLLGFLYFRFKPVTYEELSIVQKYQYAQAKSLTQWQQANFLQVVKPQVEAKYLPLGEASTFVTLLLKLSVAFRNIPRILVNYFKERHYLHGSITFVLVNGMFKLTNNEGVPIWALAIFGYIAGYIVNYFWEWYFAKRGNKFDINDVLAGAWAGALAGLLC